MDQYLGLTMRNLGLRLNLSIIILILMFASSFAQATLANCPACMGEQPDWTESATAFLEGKTVQDAPSTLSGPQQARLLNAQIDARKKTSQASNAEGNTTVKQINSPTASFDISLNNIRALPNPANLNDEVKIMAVFGNISSNSSNSDSTSEFTDFAHLTVHADIKNSEGLDAGRVDLKPSLENGFSGVWNASVQSGIYNATIEVSGPDGLKTFKDALQIGVIGIP